MAVRFGRGINLEDIEGALTPEQLAEIQEFERQADRVQGDAEVGVRRARADEDAERTHLLKERLAATSEAKRQKIDEDIRLLNARTESRIAEIRARADADVARNESSVRRIERQATVRAQAAAKRRASAARHEAVQVGTPHLTATTILPESNEVRFLDALINIAVAAVTVVWTATRPATSALGWATFWMLLGGLMAVEGRGELRYGGFAVSSANAAYLALRVAQLVKTNPQSAFVAAREVQAAYARGDYAAMPRVAARFLDLG